MIRRKNRQLCGAVMLCFGAMYAVAGADEPLHQRIDTLILERAAGKVPARLADDAEFIRRISLDLTGGIPASQAVRDFLAETEPDKRTKLIDALLNGPDYPRRMTDAFHVMLMERTGDHSDWTSFLRTSFEKNKPWDQMVREIVYPDSDDETRRGAAFFWTKRLENYGQNPVDLPGLARDVGRMFLGVDLQCAQCHDHLFVDEYKQADFQGLFAFVSHTTIRKDVKHPAVAENLMAKKLEFASVFTKDKHETGPRLPRGVEVEVPTFSKGEEFEIAPDKKKNFAGVPRFSPLKVLSEQLPRAGNPLFTRNIVNRLWYLMLGRGLVHPIDLHHKDNQPSHPELLDLLAQEFTAHQFDIKWLLREISLSQTYQRSSVLPEGAGELPAESFLVALEKPLSAEQILRAMRQATGESPRDADKAGSEPGDDSKLRDRFLRAFANPPKEPETEFAPSVKAALFMSNDNVVLSWLSPRKGNLVERLAATSEPDQLAGELYLSVLTRQPTSAERAEVAAFLAKQASDRPKAVGQLVWALLTSTEFCVNH